MKNKFEQINGKLREIVEVLNDLVDFEGHYACINDPSKKKPSFQWHYLTNIEEIEKDFYNKIMDKESGYLDAMQKKVSIHAKSKTFIVLPILIKNNIIGALKLTAKKRKFYSKYIFWLCGLIMDLGMKSIDSKKVANIWKNLRYGILHRKAYFSGVPTINEILEEYLDRCLFLLPEKKIWGTVKILGQEQFISSGSTKQYNLPDISSGQKYFTYRAMKNANKHEWEKVYNTSIKLEEAKMGRWLEKLTKITVPSISDLDEKYSHLFSRRKIKTNVMIPSIYNDQLVALFSFSSPYQNAIDMDSLWALLIICADAAPLIENARYREHTELQNRWLYNLHSTSCKINQTLDINNVLEETLKSTLKVSRADSANIMVLRNTSDPDLCINEAPMYARSAGLKQGFDQHICPRSNGLTRNMLTLRKVCYIENPDNQPYLNPIAKKYGIKSYICLPLTFQGHITGALFIHYKQPHYFSGNEVQMLSLFANQAAATIGNALLATKLKALNDIGRKFVSAHDLDTIIDSITDYIVQLTRAQKSLFLLVDRATKQIKGAYGKNYTNKFLQELSFDEISQGISGWVLEHKEPVLIADATKDSRNKGIALENAIKHNTGPIAVAPLIVKDEAVGTLTTCNERGGAQFSEDDLKLIVMLGNHAAVAIENFDLLFKTKIDAAKTFHTIKGMASTIVAGIYNVQLAVEKRKNYEKHIKNAIDISKSLKKIVNRLVAITSPAKFEKEWIDIHQLIGAVIKEMNIKRGQVTIKVAKEIPGLFLDKNALTRAIKEIVANSVEVKANDISIQVSLLKKEDYQKIHAMLKKRDILIRIAERGVMISIADDGPGIHQKYKKTIFDPLIKFKPDGTGLGLYYVALRIDELKGNVYENGIHGDGARFNILLPLQKEEEDVENTIG
jgi:GAF domain-containing protein